MADLRGLQFVQNPEVVQTLTNDFGSMTNEILRQSRFYENHHFEINEDQKQSAFNSFLRQNIERDSKILLLTYILNNDKDDEISSSIALDFSHKIRQYYSGNSDECFIPRILNGYQGSEHLNFEKLETIFEKLDKIKTRVKRELEKAQKSFITNIKLQIQNLKKLENTF